MTKAELETELARVTSRLDAHWQYYLDACRRIDVLTVELREAREALQRIAGCDWTTIEMDLRNIAREALK